VNTTDTGLRLLHDPRSQLLDPAHPDPPNQCARRKTPRSCQRRRLTSLATDAPWPGPAARLRRSRCDQAEHDGDQGEQHQEDPAAGHRGGQRVQPEGPRARQRLTTRAGVSPCSRRPRGYGGTPTSRRQPGTVAGPAAGCCLVTAVARLRTGQAAPQAPDDLAANPEAVRAAVQQAPKLHRFVNTVPDWLVQAAHIVLDRYGGDAGRLWSDAPTAVELRRRLEAFPGIGQKKAAMAVEILARDLGQPLQELTGSDVAYDVHLQRVFLRTGLAEHDRVDHMVAVAPALYPDCAGALDMPAWDIGRRWCRPADPDCPACPLNTACPRLIERGSQVRGV